MTEITITTSTDSQGRIVAAVTTPDGTSEYRTAPNGCGLWVWQQRAAEWRQIEGTSQFGAKNRSDMARKLRRRFAA